MNIVRKYVGELNGAPYYAHRCAPMYVGNPQKLWQGYIGYLEITVLDRVITVSHALSYSEAGSLRASPISIVEESLKHKALEALWDEFFA